MPDPASVTAHRSDASLHRRNARLYLVGLGASLVGNSAMSLVAGIWVKSLTGSDGLAGAVAVMIYLPSLGAPVVGAWVDRVRRQPLLVWANVLSAAALLPLLLVESAADVWLIFVVMLAYGVSLVVTDPAENALFSTMLPRDVREQVNGIRFALQEGGKFVAPLIGASLFAATGGGAVALVDAATFLVAAAAIMRLTVYEPAPAPSTRYWRTDLGAGIDYLREDRSLATLVIGAAAAMAVSGIATPAGFAVVEALGRPPSFLGVVSAAVGAGSIVASIASAPLIGRIREGRLAAWGLGNGAVGFVLIASTTVPTVLVGAVTLGFALPWVVIAVVNLAQRHTPLDLQGRVFGVVTVALFAPQPLAQGVGAALITQSSHRQVYAIAAMANLFVLAWLLHRRGRTQAGTSTDAVLQKGRARGRCHDHHDA